MTLQYATELSGFQSVKLSSFSNTEHRIQKWFIRIKVYFVFSKQEEQISSRHFFQKIKTSCVRMTKIGNVQNSG